MPILASFCKISKNLLVLEAINQLFEQVFLLQFALFLLLQEGTHICLQLLHLGVEINLLITVAKIDVFAWHEAPTFFLNLIEGSWVAIFWLVVIGIFIPYTLPVMEVLGNLLYLLS